MVIMSLSVKDVEVTSVAIPFTEPEMDLLVAG